MTVKSLNAFSQKVGPLPIVVAYLDRLHWRPLLESALHHPAYVEAVELLVKNILLEPLALYRLAEWGQRWDSRWIGPLPGSDDADWKRPSPPFALRASEDRMIALPIHPHGCIYLAEFLR